MMQWLLDIERKQHALDLISEKKQNDALELIAEKKQKEQMSEPSVVESPVIVVATDDNNAPDPRKTELKRWADVSRSWERLVNNGPSALTNSFSGGKLTLHDIFHASPIGDQDFILDFFVNFESNHVRKMTHLTYYNLLKTTTEFNVREGDITSQREFMQVIANVVNGNMIYKQPATGADILRASGVFLGQAMELFDALLNAPGKLVEAKIKFDIRIVAALLGASEEDKQFLLGMSDDVLANDPLATAIGAGNSVMVIGSAIHQFVVDGYYGAVEAVKQGGKWVMSKLYVVKDGAMVIFNTFYNWKDEILYLAAAAASVVVGIKAGSAGLMFGLLGAATTAYGLKKAGVSFGGIGTLAMLAGAAYLFTQSGDMLATTRPTKKRKR